MVDENGTQHALTDSVVRFARDLTALRESVGLTQARFAQHIAYSRQAVSVAEKGVLVPSEAIVEKYVRAAGGDADLAAWRDRRAGLVRALRRTTDRSTDDGTPARTRPPVRPPLPQLQDEPGPVAPGRPEPSSAAPSRRSRRGPTRRAGAAAVLGLALVALLLSPGAIGGTDGTDATEHPAPGCPGAGCAGQNPFVPVDCSHPHTSASDVVPILDARNVPVAELSIAESARCGTRWAKVSTLDELQHQITVTLLPGTGEPVTAGEKDDFVYTTMLRVDPTICYVGRATVLGVDGTVLNAETQPVC